MALIKYDPFAEFSGIVNKMNEFLSDIDSNLPFERRGFYPNTDIYEDEKNIYLDIELPGISKDNVQVKVRDNNVLYIKGEKKKEEKKEDEKSNIIRMERSYGEFTRYFSLPDNVNNEKINAKYDNGVLHLTIEKKEPEKPKEQVIAIK